MQAEQNKTGDRICPCEANIPAALLADFACGNPECWRTAGAAASFEAYVAEVIRRRGEEPPASETR